MSIRIKRNTGIIGAMSHCNILLDGNKVDEIEDQEIINLTIPDEGANIQLTQLGVKTKEVYVKDGDHLEVSTTFLGKYGLFILIILASLFNNYVRYGLFIVYIIAFIAIDGLMYDLTKTSSGTT